MKRMFFIEVLFVVSCLMVFMLGLLFCMFIVSSLKLSVFSSRKWWL